MTVFTCVCCSMISETQIAYECCVRRHGRSRAFLPNQSSSVAARGRLCFSRTLRRITKPLTLTREIVKPLTSYTCKLNDEQATALKAYLQEHHFKSREVPYARFAGEKDKLNVVFYESGKLVLQGKDTREFIEFVLEPEILKEARLGYETVLNPDLLLPRLGVDESGKGDFFGPLCVAGVYVN